ncbi:MAG: redoxin domain-containing protein [Deltaproteobacteria bacterium]|nr:redoxin domain-containing protein [Deltaproteobacteria bacterium]MCH7915385.1 redoxin domain-containing protein [Deltaproteobacteria bacterium]
MSSLRAGEEAPDFELPTLDGERVRLSQFRGHKHVLLEFGSIT